MYYRGADAAILVYDVTKADSLEMLKTWVAGTGARPTRARPSDARRADTLRIGFALCTRTQT